MKRLVVTFGLSAVLLAACGGSGSAGGAKSAYIVLGDTTCTGTLSSIASIGAGTDTATLERARDEWKKTYDTLKAIPVPAEDDAIALAFVAAVHNASLTSEDAVQASMIGDHQRVQSAVQARTDAAAQAGKFAKTYGFETCSEL